MPTGVFLYQLSMDFFPFPDYDIEHMVGETDQQRMLTLSSPKPPRVKTYQEITLL